MGVQFKRIKITSKSGMPLAWQEWSDPDLPPLFPLIGITRLTNEGRAQKYSMPSVTTDGNGKKIYKTIWQPMGQEGWTEKIQCTVYNKDSEATGIETPIGLWQTVNTGELVYISSNCCNEYGEVDTTAHIPYESLPDGSIWYVDHILLQSKSEKSGVLELTLIIYNHV
jgi:hypothetical protein